MAVDLTRHRAKLRGCNASACTSMPKGRSGRRLFLSVAAAVSFAPSKEAMLSAHSWRASSSREGSSRIRQPAFNFELPSFGELLGQEEEKLAVPKDGLDVLSDIRYSTTHCLQLGYGKLDIELPPGLLLGVEAENDVFSKVKNKLLSPSKELFLFDQRFRTKEEKVLQTNKADRELARAVLGMLEPVGSLAVAFRTPKLAKEADYQWNLKPQEGKTLSFPKLSAPNPADDTISTSVASRREEEIMDNFCTKVFGEMACNCLVAVAPKKEQMALLERMNTLVGNKMGIILLNARFIGNRKSKLPPRIRENALKEYTHAFHLRCLKKRRNSVVYSRRLKDGKAPWILAQQNKLGGLTTTISEVMKTSEEPGKAEIDEAFKNFDTKEKDLGETIIDSLATDKT